MHYFLSELYMYTYIYKNKKNFHILYVVIYYNICIYIILYLILI